MTYSKQEAFPRVCHDVAYNRSKSHAYISLCSQKKFKSLTDALLCWSRLQGIAGIRCTNGRYSCRCFEVADCVNGKAKCRLLAGRQVEGNDAKGLGSKGGPEKAAAADRQGGKRALQPEETLSEYYIETEGTLLGEFGAFLGRIADRLDEELQARAALQ
jgi:hypothetical protein